MLCVKSPNRLRYAESLREGLTVVAEPVFSPSPSTRGGSAGVEATSEGDLRDRSSVCDLEMDVEVPDEVEWEFAWE